LSYLTFGQKYSGAHRVIFCISVFDKRLDLLIMSQHLRDQIQDAT